MITTTGRVLQYHGKKLCVNCSRITDHTCFHMKYPKHPTNEDAYEKEESWNCNICHTNKTITKEIPEPTEKSMLVKLLMSLSEKYELAGSTIEVRMWVAW